jgi:uncharacterized membrane protein YqgA involved in biofilm formation
MLYVHMIGIGTLVNAGAILLGTAAGVIIKTGMPQRFKDTVLQGIGLSILFVGISGTLQGILRPSPSGFDRVFLIETIIFLVIGAVLGELAKIEQRLEHAGEIIQKRFPGDSRVSEGFVTATLIFCVGAMAIVGSLEDGLSGNRTTLYAKAVLDGVISLVLASTLGAGVGLSALSILLYQGTITLLASSLRPLLTPDVITQMSIAGSVLIAAIGFNILTFPKIRVGNLLPAIFLPPLWYAVREAGFRLFR